jgi:hypothetical protein
VLGKILYSQRSLRKALFLVGWLKILLQVSRITWRPSILFYPLIKDRPIQLNQKIMITITFQNMKMMKWCLKTNSHQWRIIPMILINSKKLYSQLPIIESEAISSLNSEEAFHSFNSAFLQGKRPHQNIAIRMIQFCKSWEAAKSIFQLYTLNNNNVDEKIYSAILRVAINMGQEEQLNSLMRAKKIQQLTLETIHNLMQIQSWDRIRSLYTQIFDLGLEPNELTISLMMKCFRKNGKVSREWFFAIKNGMDSITVDGYFFKLPKAVQITPILTKEFLRSYLTPKDFWYGLNYFRECLELGYIDQQTVEMILDYCSRSFGLKKTMYVFRQTMLHGLKPTAKMYESIRLAQLRTSVHPLKLSIYKEKIDPNAVHQGDQTFSKCFELITFNNLEAVNIFLTIKNPPIDWFEIFLRQLLDISNVNIETNFNRLILKYLGCNSRNHRLLCDLFALYVGSSSIMIASSIYKKILSTNAKPYFPIVLRFCALIISDRANVWDVNLLPWRGCEWNYHSVTETGSDVFGLGILISDYSDKSFYFRNKIILNPEVELVNIWAMLFNFSPNLAVPPKDHSKLVVEFCTAKKLLQIYEVASNYLRDAKISDRDHDQIVALLLRISQLCKIWDYQRIHYRHHLLPKQTVE